MFLTDFEFKNKMLHLFFIDLTNRQKVLNIKPVFGVNNSDAIASHWCTRSKAIQLEKNREFAKEDRN